MYVHNCKNTFSLSLKILENKFDMEYKLIDVIIMKN